MRAGSAIALIFAFLAVPMVMIALLESLDSTATLPSGISNVFDLLPMIWMVVAGLSVFGGATAMLYWLFRRLAV